MATSGNTDDPKEEASSSTQNLKDGTFFAIGNPLLDMSMEIDQQFLERHNLKGNQIVLATKEHDKLFEEILKKARYASGGSSQNIMRTIVWFLSQPKVATFMGCVGNDFYQIQLKAVGDTAGINTVYQIHESLNTGVCAVLVNPNEQSTSMVANLGAAEAFTHSFLENKQNWHHVEQASILFSEGYFLVSNRESFMRICEHAHKANKIFCLTLSAKYICDDPFGSRLLSALPYADIVFGREDEAKKFAQSQLNIEAKDLYSAMKAIRDVIKFNNKRQRIVVISKSKTKTTICTVDQIKEYPWRIPPRVISAHGCEDAFIGGFLAYFALGKNVDECARGGLYCAYEKLTQLGCQYPPQANYDPNTFFQNKDDD